MACHRGRSGRDGLILMCPVKAKTHAILAVDGASPSMLTGAVDKRLGGDDLDRTAPTCTNRARHPGVGFPCCAPATAPAALRLLRPQRSGPVHRPAAHG